MNLNSLKGVLWFKRQATHRPLLRTHFAILRYSRELSYREVKGNDGLLALTRLNDKCYRTLLKQ